MMMHRSALTWIQVSGVDARTFLQSQITGECRTLNVGEALFTGYCQAQGRLLATLLFACTGEENGNAEFALILPKTMVEATQARLQKFIMRSKVNMVVGDGAVLQSPQPFTDSNVLPSATFTFLGSHWGLIPTASLTATPLPIYPETSHTFEMDQGLVWITPTTVEMFVPQMIGLDQIGGVSFNKGCYPGQEVVARLHFLGKSKRGLFQAKINANAPNPLDDAWLGKNVRDADGKNIGTLCALAAPDRALVVMGQEQTLNHGFLVDDVSGQATVIAQLHGLSPFARTV